MQMTGLVGAVCGIAVGFIFPGMLAWKGEAGLGWRAFAVLLLVTGTALMVAGIAAPFIEASGGSPDNGTAMLLARLGGRL